MMRFDSLNFGNKNEDKYRRIKIQLHFNSEHARTLSYVQLLLQWGLVRFTHLSRSRDQEWGSQCMALEYVLNLGPGYYEENISIERQYDLRLSVCNVPFAFQYNAHHLCRVFSCSRDAVEYST